MVTAYLLFIVQKKYNLQILRYLYKRLISPFDLYQSTIIFTT